MHRQPAVHRAPDRRTNVGLIAVAAGFVLAAFRIVVPRAVHAMTVQPSSAAQSVGWTTWIEAGINFIKLVQMVAFVFGAYQFWANRKERLAADATNDAQARKDAN